MQIPSESSCPCSCRLAGSLGVHFFRCCLGRPPICAWLLSCCDDLAVPEGVAACIHMRDMWRDALTSWFLEVIRGPVKIAVEEPYEAAHMTYLSRLFCVRMGEVFVQLGRARPKQPLGQAHLHGTGPGLNHKEARRTTSPTTKGLDL